jgi:hypothetical protein
MKTKGLLLPFYFGSLNDQERIEVERALLTDLETLTDYLDLKRRLEASPLPASRPSRSLWERLMPRTQKQKRLYLSLSVGAALAAGLAIAFILHSRPKSTELMPPPVTRILFDSSSELPASSSVL